MAGPDLRGARWSKSSRSGNNGNCVEVAFIRDAVATRDSKHPADAALVVSGSAWSRFLAFVTSS